MPITTIQNPADIQLNDHNDIDQILGHPPSWILHWGLSLVFIATLLFGLLAWLIKYPDVIPTKIQILTENPAIRLVPLTSGKIEELLVHNQQSVQKGELLAVLESAAKRKDIEKLEKAIQQLEKANSPTDYLAIRLSAQLKLGSLQAQYSALLQKIKDYQYYLRQTHATSKTATLQAQIGHTRSLNKSLEKQQQTLSQEVAIVRKNWQRSQQLNKEGIISDQELEQTETTYLQYQRQLDNFQTQMINNQVQVEQLESQILDLAQNYADGSSSKTLAIKENSQNLKSQITVWKQNYLLQASIAGKVSLSAITSANQFVQAGTELLTIVPAEGAGKIIGKALLPIENSGKVAVGQTVNIYLDGFPYQEYGILKAKVSQLSLVPEKEHYTLALQLPDSLWTTYHKTIPFMQEMQGTGNVITEDQRILQRIFDRVWSLLKNS